MQALYLRHVRMHSLYHARRSEHGQRSKRRCRTLTARITWVPASRPVNPATLQPTPSPASSCSGPPRSLLLWANSPFGDSYRDVFAWAFGPASLGLHKSLGLWISDGLMAIFFLYVGLEIKREIVEGQLSSRDRIALPAIAALGGMIVPALFFLGINHGDPLAARGWAVPCATDIAFSLAVIRMLGNRVPISLRVFLTAVAILDDIGAIAVIAVFYTATLSPGCWRWRSCRSPGSSP